MHIHTHATDTTQWLQELHASGNELGKSVISSLVDLVRSQPQLEVLDVNSNAFGDSCVESLPQQMDAVGRPDVLREF